MSKPSASTFLALSCVGALVTAPAAAADPVKAGAPDPQTAQERRDDPNANRDIIVTAINGEEDLESPKATAPLLDTPQTITVISDQVLRKQNLLTLRDALQTVPGITFGAGEGGGGYGDSINLRGYSANNDITQDGVRDTAQYSRTDPFNLQQIEVYNGANTVFSGSGSVGGTINLVSKTPQRENLTIVSGGIGTDNYYRATVDSNLRVSDLVAVRLNAMYHENDVPGRDVESYERWGVAPSIKIGVEGPTSLTLAYVHQEDDNTPIYGVPYYSNGIYDGPLPGVDDSSYYGIVNLDRQQTVVDRLTATFAHEFSEGVSIRNLTRYQRIYQPTSTSAPQSATGGTSWCLADGTHAGGGACVAGMNTPGTYYPSGPRGLVRDQLNDLLYNQTDLTIRSGEKGSLRNTLVIGASFAQEDYELRTAQLLRTPDGTVAVQPPIDLSNPDTIWRGPVNRIETGRSEGNSTSAAVYAFDTLELGEMFEINLGARWEKVDAVFRVDTVTTPATGSVYARGLDQVSEEELFSYRGGLVFKPSANTSLYASYANSKTPGSATVRLGCGALIVAPSGLLDPCDVEPEKAVNYEIGAKADLFNKRLQLTLAVFRNERTNYRVATNDPVVTTLAVTDGQSRVDGIALGASGNITPAWSIFANYTYLDSEVRQSVSNYCLANPGPVGGANPCGNSAAVLDPQAGQQLTNTPKHSGSLFTTYTLPFGLQLGYGLTYQGDFALNNSALVTPLAPTTALTPVFRSDDYITQRAFLSYAFAGGLTAQVNVQNLFNERYYTGIRNNGWATPGEGRSAVFSLFYSF